MQHPIFFTALLFSLLNGTPSIISACDTHAFSEACKSEYQIIAQQLLTMEKKDQASIPTADNAAISRIYQENTEKLKTIYRTIGWPTRSKVGEEAASAAWLLVQHSDDVSFQEEILGIMGPLVANQELHPSEYAHLLDRVLVKQGKPQIYGTQAKGFDTWPTDEPVFYPIANLEYIDYLRFGVGLRSLDWYRGKLARFRKAMLSNDTDTLKALLEEDQP
jgi:hypothetical protein